VAGMPFWYALSSSFNIIFAIILSIASGMVIGLGLGFSSFLMAIAD
jgi:hypothetical protein